MQEWEKKRAELLKHRDDVQRFANEAYQLYQEKVGKLEPIDWLIGVYDGTACPKCKKNDWSPQWEGSIRRCACGHRQWRFRCWSEVQGSRGPDGFGVWQDHPPELRHYDKYIRPFEHPNYVHKGFVPLKDEFYAKTKKG